MVFSQHSKLLAKLFATGAFIVSMLASGLVHAEYALNFQEPVTEVARDIYSLHMAIFYVCVVIFVLVFGVMFYSIFKHRKSKNYEPSQFSHSTSVEIVWTIIPFFILVGMAIPATKVLIDMEDTTKSDLTIKITGYQWKWGYEYLDTDISFYSTLTTPVEQINQFDVENAQEQGENYLLEVDNYVVVPAGRKVRALITANDVIHAWWIPAFGTKKDAIPGYINELWFNVDEDKTGIYRGQCAELCGKDHAFMPIVVKVVSGEEFDKWLAAGGTFDAAPIAQSQVQESTIVRDVADTVVDAIVTTANAQVTAVSEEAPTQALVAGDSLPLVDEAANVVDAIATKAKAQVTTVSEETSTQTPVLEDPLSLDDETVKAVDESLTEAGDVVPVVDEVTAAAIEEAAAASTGPSEDTMALGKKVYATCSACHGAQGGGIPGVFPAITGSAVATGPADAHIDIVMFGKAGTAMAAFANQYSDEEIAAVVTYQRNALGNNVGDVVLPADISAKRN